MIADRIARRLQLSPLRIATLSNFISYFLALVASLGAFRAMIVLTSTQTVGLWTLINGLAAMLAAAEMGLGANLVRYVASRPEVSRRLLFRLAVMAGLTCLMPVTILAAALAWPVYQLGITRPDLPVTASDVAVMTGIALSTNLINVGILVLSGLAEGIGRLSQRSLSTLLLNVVILATLWPAVARFGAVGIAYAYLAGYLAQLAMVLTILVNATRHLPRTGDEPSMGGLFRELFRSTMQNFGVTLIGKTLDPVTRLYIGLNGSLTVQAWFELAHRITGQVRILVMTGLQPLLYVGASNQASLTDRFERPRAFAVRVAALMFGAIVCASPILSAVLLGAVEQGFIALMLILGLGTAIFIVGLPGYYALMARAQFGMMLRIYAKAVVWNAIVGASVLIGASWFGPTIAMSAAFALIGLDCIRSYVATTGRTLLSQFDGFWLGCAISGAIGAGLVFAAGRYSALTVIAISLAAGLLLLPTVLSLWKSLLKDRPTPPLEASNAG